MLEHLQNSQEVLLGVLGPFLSTSLAGWVCLFLPFFQHALDWDFHGVGVFRMLGFISGSSWPSLQLELLVPQPLVTIPGCRFPKWNRA